MKPDTPQEYELRGAPMNGDSALSENGYKYALFSKKINLVGIQDNYGSVLEKYGLSMDDFLCIEMLFNDKGKAPAKEGRAFLNFVLKHVIALGVSHIMVADSTYFKLLTKESKVTAHYGTHVQCAITGYEHIEVIPVANYMAAEYNPQIVETIDLSCVAFASRVGATKIEGYLGKGVIRKAEYPDSYLDISNYLDKIILNPVLACDIETFSLRIDSSGIGTIGFASSMDTGGAFLVDLNRPRAHSISVKSKLKEFFIEFHRRKGKLIFHNGNFDVPRLIYNLFMDSPTDYKGMRYGIRLFLDMIEDSMFLAFLCLNTTVKPGPDLSLKTLSKPLLGNYAEDVTDISVYKPVEYITAEETKVRQQIAEIEAGYTRKEYTKAVMLKMLPKVNPNNYKPDSLLLEYNLKDCLGTMFVHDVYRAQAEREDLLEYYDTILKPSLRFVWEMQLVGLPINLNRVEEIYEPIRAAAARAQQHLANTRECGRLMTKIGAERMVKENAKLKTITKPLKHFIPTFNINSSPQVSRLLYEEMKLPVLNTTEAGNPSTQGKVLKRLLNDHLTKGSFEYDIVKTLVDYADTKTILSTFIPAFRRYAWDKGTEGVSWLNGNFNLTGTQSGRLSSNDPNMQNIPSNSQYGDDVKSCFVAPEGWLFATADFSSLEDRINAILTKDPNKIRVYTEGFDGHCLRAYTYFKDQMEGIDPTSAESINTIETKYPELRQKSKAPTFAFQYRGTWKTVCENLGIPDEEGQALEANFKSLYSVSELYFIRKVMEAMENGFIRLSFGLRLLTPMLHGKRDPHKLFGMADKEAKSMYNADSQTWGTLTNRALIEFADRLDASEQHIQEGLLLILTVHDAGYVLVKDTPEHIKWLNDNLIECMNWQDHPAIMSDDVPIEADLEFGYSWDKLVKVHNGASLDEIIKIRAKLDA